MEDNNIRLSDATAAMERAAGQEERNTDAPGEAEHGSCEEFRSNEDAPGSVGDLDVNDSDATEEGDHMGVSFQNEPDFIQVQTRQSSSKGRQGAPSSLEDTISTSADGENLPLPPLPTITPLKSAVASGTDQVRGSRQRRNSLALRKNIPIRFSDGMAKSSMSSSDLYDVTNEVNGASRQLTDGSSSTNNEEKPRSSKKRSSRQQRRKLGFLRQTCLNPWLSLRTQMMLSFGCVGVIVICVVMTVCIIVTVLSGQKVNEITSVTFNEMAVDIEGTTVRYIAEFVHYRLIPSDLVQIIWETTRDRMAGYPDALGFPEDANVPFFDVESGTNRYPIVAPPLPLDWQLHDYLNVGEDNHQEHVQDRWSWYQMDQALLEQHGMDPICLSTATAGYFMQGMCDPNVTDPTHPTYYPGCTNANNNVETGGVVAPTKTNKWLHRKSADLTPVLKALYEYHHDVKDLGVGFANDGAGSSVQFPLFNLHSGATYVSQGCNWMIKANPYAPERSIGTPKMIEKCHPEGTTVSHREYNPLERDWCRNQALEPKKVHIEGPRLDELSYHGVEEYRWMMTVGRALYDRVTNEFIGCMKVNVVLDFLEEVLSQSCASRNSHITVIRWDDQGTVVASSAWNMTTESTTTTIDKLDVGMTRENYLELKNLINYDEAWNATELRDKYEQFVTEKDGFLIGAHPMPPPPEEYDPDYRPLFLAVKSLSRADVFEQLYHSQGVVDEKVEDLVNLSLFIGLIGIAVVLFIIGLVSGRLTSPLNFMNDVATDIVNTYVDSREEGIEYVLPEYASCFAPRTEISEVVSEFQKMVARFSGTSNAKSMKGGYTEMKNGFELGSHFVELYSGRQDKKFRFRLEEGSPREETEAKISPGAGTSASPRKHLGTVICVRDDDLLLPFGFKNETSDDEWNMFAQQRKWFLSPLFTWILLLIATPMLVTTITLSAIVTHRISAEFPELVEDAKTDYLTLQLFALQVYVALRADFVSAVTSRSTRDLHLLTRYSSWLLFGGVERADSFTELVTGVEECKVYENKSDCPYTQEYPCSCDWNEPGKTCSNYSTDSRYLQRITFISESLDVRADGDRNSTNFPKEAYSPQTTAWWDDATLVPGFEKGGNASGYDTTYDRLRVLSALPLLQPLYNYDSDKEYVEGISVAMEDDGTFLSFNGCNGFGHASKWSSSQSNGGPDTRPEICPEGKYGYDARCREWYDTGRSLYHGFGNSFYLTAPYQYGAGNFAQSATSPLVDPQTKRHVGQALIDFNSNNIFEALGHQNTPLYGMGYPVLITANPDSFVGDTVIGPGFASDGPAPSIEELVFSGAEGCAGSVCTGQQEFRDAVSLMKRGSYGSSRFPKKGDDGSVRTMNIAHAPVVVKVHSPKNSSDFARGIDAGEQVIYSLGLIISIEGLLEPFEAIEENIDRQMDVAVITLCIAIVVAGIILVYISATVAASIAKPMVYLKSLITHLNRLSVDDITSSASPEVNKDYGCREVRHVSSTMEVLYKVVRDANVAFFAGDVETAYAVLVDTLRLFVRLDNKKAIGVSNNNLGNTMLTMYRRMESSGEETVCGFTQREIVEKGVGYFHKAIKLGEAAYDEFYETEGWSPNCLEFMQHLSNRYFNRAMFLLTVKDSHKNPKELEELGFRDLQIVRDMDVEIVDEGTQVGWNVRTPDQLFEVKLSRIKGHLQLLEMGYPDDWEVDEHIEDACKIVKDEMKNASSKLFADLSPAGRMQQVENELMRYLMLKEDLTTAAKVAIRMLMEDEYTLPDAQLRAVEVLVAYVKSVGDEALQEEVGNFQIWVNAVSKENDFMLSTSDGPDTSDMSEVFQLSTARLSTASTLTDMGRSRRSTLRESSRGDFTMEIF